MNCVPPLYFSKIFQTSEPEDATPEGFTYATFKEENGFYIFCGDCLAGKTENKSKFYEIN